MNVEDGDLSHSFGTSLNYRIIAGYPFLFDINWFSSRFEYTGDDENNPLYEAYKIRHRGLELAVNFVLLPSNSHFIPYAGIGYQSASLIASNLWPMESSDDENKSNSDTEAKKYKSNCSGPIWKAGVMLEYRRATFSIEYKQSLNAKSEKASNQLSIGIGLLY
jgi:outer membrane protein assembly factor BamA